MTDQKEPVTIRSTFRTLRYEAAYDESAGAPHLNMELLRQLRQVRGVFEVLAGSGVSGFRITVMTADTPAGKLTFNRILAVFGHYGYELHEKESS